MSRRSTWRKAARRPRNHSPHLSLGRLLYRRRLRLEPLEDRRLLAVVTVTTLADTVDFNDGVTSLREAIFATNTVPGADTINFAPALTSGGPATILLTQGELVITDELTINGPGADLLTIDASGNDPTPDEKSGDGTRIFNFDLTVEALDGDSPVDLGIKGVTLTGGDASGPGGALFSRSQLTMIDCVIIGNASRSAGGGVAVFGLHSNNVGESGLFQCQFVGNTSRGNGGGLAVIDNSIAGSSHVLISGCVFDGNSASLDGGGINGGSGLQVVDSTISENEAIRSGGGIYGSNVMVEGSLIHGNAAGKAGGGLDVRGETTIVNSTIGQNSADVRPTWDFPAVVASRPLGAWWSAIALLSKTSVEESQVAAPLWSIRSLRVTPLRVSIVSRASAHSR